MLWLLESSGAALCSYENKGHYRYIQKSFLKLKFLKLVTSLVIFQNTVNGICLHPTQRAAYSASKNRISSTGVEPKDWVFKVFALLCIGGYFVLEPPLILHEVGRWSEERGRWVRKYHWNSLTVCMNEASIFPLRTGSETPHSGQSSWDAIEEADLHKVRSCLGEGS